MYLYKALYGYVGINITFVKRVNHGRTRRSQTHLRPSKKKTYVSRPRPLPFSWPLPLFFLLNFL